MALVILPNQTDDEILGEDKKTIRELLSKRIKTNGYSNSSPKSIDDSIRMEKAKLDNEEQAQKIKLKRLTLILLFIFLGIETATIFVIAFFQGFNTRDFKLENWSFDLIIFATITQITTMLLVAVKHLFPKNHN